VSQITNETRLRDRYVLKRRIAVGGMGEVWRAEDIVLGRQVAIKILKPTLGHDASFLERFRREARHTAALSHPGIAQVFDYNEEQGRAYLVMELVPGEPLSTMLTRHQRLDVDQTLDIVAQTAEALQVAHDAGVVHRDVKPGNVLVMPDGKVKITDFGIARAADGTSLTQTGRVMGTAHYLSPEQAAGQKASPASDIYALGVVTYECLAGNRPFGGRSDLELAEAHLRESPSPLPEDVPGPVQDLVARLLAKDPNQRPRRASDLAREITRLRARMSGRSAEPPAQSGQTPAPAPSQSQARAAPPPADPRGGGRRRQQAPRHQTHNRQQSHRQPSRRRRPQSSRQGIAIRVAILVVSVVAAVVAGVLWFANNSDAAAGRVSEVPRKATGRSAGQLVASLSADVTVPGTVSWSPDPTGRGGKSAWTVKSAPTYGMQPAEAKGKAEK
jgi:serine/threonine protein kinase